MESTSATRAQRLLGVLLYLLLWGLAALLVYASLVTGLGFRRTLVQADIVLFPGRIVWLAIAALAGLVLATLVTTVLQRLRIVPWLTAIEEDDRRQVPPHLLALAPWFTAAYVLLAGVGTAVAYSTYAAFAHGALIWHPPFGSASVVSFDEIDRLVETKVDHGRRRVYVAVLRNGEEAIPAGIMDLLEPMTADTAAAVRARIVEAHSRK